MDPLSKYPETRGAGLEPGCLRSCKQEVSLSPPPRPSKILPQPLCSCPCMSQTHHQREPFALPIPVQVGPVQFPPVTEQPLRNYSLGQKKKPAVAFIDRVMRGQCLDSCYFVPSHQPPFSFSPSAVGFFVPSTNSLPTAGPLHGSPSFIAGSDFR